MGIPWEQKSRFLCMKIKTSKIQLNLPPFKYHMSSNYTTVSSNAYVTLTMYDTFFCKNSEINLIEITVEMVQHCKYIFKNNYKS